MTICAALVFGSGWASWAEAATFHLDDGTRIDGEVVKVVGPNLAVRTAGGGVVMVATSRVATVVVGPVIGTYQAWAGDIYELRRGHEIISVREGGEVVGRQALPTRPLPPQGAVAVESTGTSLVTEFEQFAAEREIPPGAGKDKVIEEFLLWRETKGGSN